MSDAGIPVVYVPKYRVAHDGTKGWYFEEDGRYHRGGDQPAITYTDGSQEWWVEGVRHRDNDQPAAVYADGTKEWWVKGKKHRIGGPAAVFPDGYEEWWENGVRVR